MQRTSDLHTSKVLYNISNKLFEQSSSVLVTASTFKHVLHVVMWTSKARLGVLKSRKENSVGSSVWL